MLRSIYELTDELPVLENKMAVSENAVLMVVRIL